MIHEHDCDECTFLGTWEGHDLFFCRRGPLPTVVARFGPGGDYMSGMLTAELMKIGTPGVALPGRGRSEPSHNTSAAALRVAWLIAADAGLVVPRHR